MFKKKCSIQAQAFLSVLQDTLNNSRTEVFDNQLCNSIQDVIICNILHLIQILNTART